MLDGRDGAKAPNANGQTLGLLLQNNFLRGDGDGPCFRWVLSEKPGPLILRRPLPPTNAGNCIYALLFMGGGFSMTPRPPRNFYGGGA